MSLVRMRNKLKASGKRGSIWVIVLLAAVVITGYFVPNLGDRGRSAEEQAREDAIAARKQEVARVGETTITRAELDDTIDKTPMGQQINALQRHMYYPMVLDSLESQALMVEAARRQGIKVDKSEVRKEIDKRVQAEAEAMGVNSLTSAEQKRQFTAQIRGGISEKSVQNELAVQKLSDELKKKVTLQTPGIKADEIEVGARHILISWKDAPGFKGRPGAPTFTRTKAQAKTLADNLALEAKKNPQGFAVLADKNTDDPSGKGKGGDLGFFSRQAMVKPFADAAFAAKPGDIVGPVETIFGYHVIKVGDRRVAESRTQQEVTKFLEEEKKKTKPVTLAPDIKAFEAYRDYQTEKFAAKPDKKKTAEKLQAAIVAYKAAAQARPGDGAVAYYLAQLYKAAGDRKNALATLQEAAVEVKTAQVHLEMGTLYQESKQVDKALQQYQIAGRMPDADQFVHQQLYTKYKQLNQPELAKAQMEWLRNASANQAQQRIPIGG